MKKIIYLFLLISHAVVAQSAFEKSNNFYKNEQYEKAAEGYESILKSGQHSSELYFNLGNSYYKLHKVAPAIYNYEKALMLNPESTEIQTNLKFAQKRTVDEIKVVPKVGFSKIVNNGLDVFHYNTWAAIGTGFSLFFLLCFVGYYFGASTMVKRLFFAAMFLALLAIVLSVLAAVLEKGNDQKERPAIVFAEKVSVKNEPKAAAPTAFELHEGTKVFVLEKQENWSKIQLTDETQGWIEKTAIKELK